MNISQIKNHLKTNAKTYLIGTGCALIGAVAAVAYVYLRGNGSKVQANTNLTVKYNWKPIVTQTVTVVFEERSNPSKPIHLVGTDRYFSSQNGAARKLNLTATSVSRHLNGLIPNVNGMVFERLTPVHQIA